MNGGATTVSGVTVIIGSFVIGIEGMESGSMDGGGFGTGFDRMDGGNVGRGGGGGGGSERVPRVPTRRAS